MIRRLPASRLWLVTAGLGLLALAPMATFGEGAPPSWVERFPADPDAYIGIGHGDKKMHPANYRAVAQSAALAQISREISVEIKTESRIAQSEGKGGWEDEYSQRITGASHNEFSGYRLAGVYETGNDFWVYYALDKEIYLESLEQRARGLESWLDGEAKALDADLEMRRIQAATERYQKIKGKYATEYANRSLPLRLVTEAPARYRAIADKILSATRGLKLASSASAWTLGFPEGRGADGPGRVEVFLVDAKSGERWTGALSLILSSRTHPEIPACRAETGSGGGLELVRPFLDCGLPPGPWRVTWMGPEGEAFSLDIATAIRAREIGMAIRGSNLPSTPASGDVLAGLERGLAALNRPYFKLVPGRPRLPVLEIDVREISVDSLEGMFFTSIRGMVRIPGVPGILEVTGKSGHADRNRSRSRAIRDFVNEAGRHFDAMALMIIMSNCPFK